MVSEIFLNNELENVFLFGIAHISYLQLQRTISGSFKWIGYNNNLGRLFCI